MRCYARQQRPEPDTGRPQPARRRRFMGVIGTVMRICVVFVMYALLVFRSDIPRPSIRRASVVRGGGAIVVVLRSALNASILMNTVSMVTQITQLITRRTSRCNSFAPGLSQAQGMRLARAYTWARPGQSGRTGWRSRPWAAARSRACAGRRRRRSGPDQASPWRAAPWLWEGERAGA